MPEKFNKQFICSRKNTEKYVIFTVPIEKEDTRIDKNKEKTPKTLSYILQIIDSARFTASSLSNLANNLSERIHRIKCKYRHDDKKCETCGTEYKYFNCFLEYKIYKDNLIENKCLHCNK